MSGARRAGACPRTALLLTVFLTLGGCAVGGSAGSTSAASEPPALAGLSATLYQTRMDVAVRQVEVKLHNGSSSDLTVRSLRLESTSFDEPMTYGRTGSIVRAGWSVDMPVALSTAVCADETGRHTVHLEYELDDGRAGAVQIGAVDEGGRIADLHADECFAADVAAVAELAITAPPHVRRLGGELVADVTVEATPGGHPGRLQLRRVGSTTLLQVVDPRTGELLPQGYDVGTASAGTQPSGFTFSVVPGRCDAHAVAEDKQGTLFPVDVALDGREGRVTVAAPARTVASLYEFVRQACSA